MRHKLRKSLLALSVFFALAVIPAAAPAEDAADVISGLQRKYESINAIKAEFTQEVTSKGLPAQASGGVVWLKKPGKMRWEYAAPEKDLIVSDGKLVWLFQPDLKQVIEKAASSATSMMAADFLTGIGDIEKDFVVILSGAEGKEHILTLTPKQEQPGIRRLILHVDKYTSIVNKTVLTDHFGNQTEVAFTRVVINPSIKDSVFKFKAPRGVSVVRP